MGTSVLTLTTSPVQLTDGLERIMHPLEKVHFPAHELAMMMTIALRFIPTLLEETDKIQKAQMARGADFESGNLIARAKAMIPLLVPLFVSSFRRANELAMAMEARCYHGGDHRTRLRELKYTKLDAFGALAMAAFLAVILRRADSLAEFKLQSHHIPSPADHPPEGQRRFKLVVEYDGTAYSGWQRQINGAERSADAGGGAFPIDRGEDCRHGVEPNGCGRACLRALCAF